MPVSAAIATLPMISLTRTPCDEGVIRGAADTAGFAERARPWVLATTILGSSMAFIDSSVVNVALPAIQADLMITVRGAQWIANAYMLMLGALILVGGSAGDRFGRRRVFALGIAIFTAASVGCGLAPNIGTLVAARAVQGIGGALLVPGSLAIISAAFPADERGKAIGTWAGFSALTTAAGPVLGGWLVDALSWRAIFFINVPIALLTLALAFRHVPGRSRDSSDGGAIDWVGGVLVTLGLAGVAYGLTAAPDSGWTDPLVLGGIIGGVVIIALFVRHEAATPLPMMPLELFRSAVFSGANAMTFLLYFALGGVMFFLPFNLIQVQGYSATLAGAAFLPFTLIMGGMSRWSGGLVSRYGARKPLTIGPIIAATGFALFAVPGRDASYWTTFFPAMAVLGLGMAVSVAPLTTTVMGAVKEQHSGTASGINNAVARVAGMLAIALLGALATGVFRSALGTHVARLQVPAEIRVALDAEVPKLAEAKVPPQVVGEQRRVLEEDLNEAFVRSFRVVMLVAAGFALTSALCAFLTVGPHHKVSR
jgi:EmrB/QacA subfamily drug resistance transporter